MASHTLQKARLASFARSHPGLQRDTNEDRFYHDAERGIFLVIDGVGGHAAGERAAETALTVLRARLERATGTAADRVREAITLANNEILRLARTRPEWAGMACVLTVVVVEDSTATIGHVGDTRLYRFQRGVASKLTSDHSPVGEREDRGELSETDAMHHPRRNEIYRDVGTEEHTPADEGFVEVSETPFEQDMALLLCTDGLTDLLPLSRIRQIVHQHAGDGSAVVERLIAAANEAGGKDNVTAVYVEGPAFADTARRYARGFGLGSLRLGAVTRAVAGLRRAGAALDAAALAVVRARWFLFVAGLASGVAISLVALDRARAIPAFWDLSDRAAVSWSRTWVVGSGSAGFTSIGEAMLHAAPGDTVIVEPGLYRESISLAAGVSLVSRRPREAVIRPPLGGPPGWTAVTVEAGTGGRLAGFSIAGDDMSPLAVGLRVEGSADVEDVAVTGASQAAVEIAAGAGGAIRACEIRDNPGVGIVVRSGSIELRHNVITGNGRLPGHPKAGLELAAGTKPVLFGNIVLHNGIEGIVGLGAEERDQVLRENVLDAQPAAPPRTPARPKT
ncbi:MAG: protein phosphatase 2C domain-containing protein [Vicinamibacterales bacterium]